MMKFLAGSAIAVVLMLAGAAPAWADRDDRGGHDGDHHGRAPEPVTVIALALGATGIAAIRIAGRKSNRKK